MHSAFVKGLMCATLLGLGVSSFINVATELIHHGPALSIFWHILGIIGLLLALALLFLRQSPGVARAAFGFLVFMALLDIGVPIWATITHTAPPSPVGRSFFYGFLYAVPCIVAILPTLRGSQNV